MDKAPDAFRTISEVADEIDVPQHVLRFWESRFPQIRPMKRGGGRRYYRPDDVDLLRGVRHLLYGEGYTIRGVQRILREQGNGFVQNIWRAGAEPPPPELAEDRIGEEGSGASEERLEPNLFGLASPRAGEPAVNEAAGERREPACHRRRAPTTRRPGACWRWKTGANCKWRWTNSSPAGASSTARWRRVEPAQNRVLRFSRRFACAHKACSTVSDKKKFWSERRDLNSGPPVPQTGALTGLRYAPKP